MCNKCYNYPTCELFCNLKILNIEKLYKLNLGKLMYRFTKGIIPNCLNTLFDMNYEIHHYQTRHCNRVHLPTNKCTAYSQSFLFRAPKLWMDLDENLINCFTLNQFKNKYKRLLLNE